MKRLVFWQLFVAALLLTGNSHAQSIKDLFNKENIEKAVNAVTGKSTADMTGTWSYTGSAIEFESDKLLKLITFLSSKSSNSTLKSIGSLANSYDGMMLGFSLQKL